MRVLLIHLLCRLSQGLQALALRLLPRTLRQQYDALNEAPETEGMPMLSSTGYQPSGFEVTMAIFVERYDLPVIFVGPKAYALPRREQEIRH